MTNQMSIDSAVAHGNRRRSRAAVSRRFMSILMCETSRNEAFEERMRDVRLRAEFGMELAGKKPWVTLDLDELNQSAVRRRARDDEAPLLHRLAVVHVELVAVAVPFEDFRAPVDLVSQSVPAEHGGARSQPHRSALLGDVSLILENADNRVRGVGVEFGAVRLVKPANIPCEFDGRDLHAQTKAQIGCSRFAGI